MPKGHAEEGESIEETALRELYEETGLQATVEQLCADICYTESYEFFHPQKKNTIHKTVSYIPVKIPYQHELPQGRSEQDGEILQKKVVSLTEAIALVSYDATRTVLEQVVRDKELR